MMEKARILIVEDETIISLGIESKLQSLGYEVTSIVNTGEKAIEKAEIEKPDLILMDIRIKGEMDGIDAAEIIRSRFAIPVIFSTAYLDEERIERAKITMPFGYVLKPIQEKDLKVTLEMALYVAKVDEERRKVEERFNLMMHQSPSVIELYDLDGLQIEVNKAYEDLWGFPASHTVNKFNILESQEVINTGLRKYVNAAYNGETVAVPPYQFDPRGETEAQGLGRIRWLSTRMYPLISDGDVTNIVVAHEDISSQKQIETSLIESEFLFSQMFEQSTTSTQLFNPEGFCLKVNYEFCKLYGVKAEDIIDGKYNILQDQNLMSERVSRFIKGIFDDHKLNKWEGLFDIAASSDLMGIPTTQKKQLYLEVLGYPILDSAGNLKYVTLHTYDITQRKRLEDDLKKSQEKYYDLLQCSTDWIWEVDINEKYTFVSEKVEEILGYRTDDIIGKSPFDLMTGEDAVRIGNIFNEIAANKKPIVDLENRNLTKDGNEVYLLTNGIPMLDDEGNLLGYRGVHKDITERKLKEKQLRQSEERYRSLIDIIPHGIQENDLSGLITLSNPKHHEIVGAKEGEIVEKKSIWEWLISNSDKDELKKYLAYLVKEQPTPSPFVSKNRTVDGRYIELQVDWTYKRDEDGNLQGFVTVLTDITEKLKAEDQIKASLKEKEILLQEIHHRVKNNMQVISSLLDLQASTVNDQRTREILQASQSRVYAMSAVHEALHGSENLSDIDLASYLLQISGAIFQTYSVDPSRIKLHIDSGTIPLGAKQAAPLGLITNELISNSLKYAFPDNQKGEIAVSLKKLENGLVLIVSDNGMGMPESFDWRKSNSLGLKLVRSLAEEQLGGSVEMESNKGTRFTIKFDVEV
jgi:PAS domain S-box-containing protein